MSYENVPKNLTEQAVLVRGGRPDYFKLAAAAFPVPTADEAGAILESTDTGDRYRWNSTSWIKIVTQGSAHVYAPNIANLLVNRFFSGPVTVSTTLNGAVAAGDRTAIVTSAVGMAVGDYVHLNGSLLESAYPIITNIAASTLTFNRPLDSAHADGSTVEIAPVQMNVVASGASPILYSVAPDAGEVFHITKLLLSITHGTAGDLGLFGNLAALTNGVAVRIFKDGVHRTLSSWRSNADIANDMYDIAFDTRSGGGGTYGTRAALTLLPANTAVQLNGDNSDRVDLLIQDDLSTLATFTAKLQGHVEEA